MYLLKLIKIERKEVEVELQLRKRITDDKNKENTGSKEDRKSNQRQVSGVKGKNFILIEYMKDNDKRRCKVSVNEERGRGNRLKKKLLSLKNKH